MTGAMKVAPVRFSWTTFFFGFFPALFRGHVLGALIQFILAMITMGISSLVFCFIYNKMYIKYLVGEGYKATHSSQDLNFLAGKLAMQIPAIAE